MFITKKRHDREMQEAKASAAQELSEFRVGQTDAYRRLNDKFRKAITDLAAARDEAESLRPDAEKWRARAEREAARGERRKVARRSAGK